VEKLAMKHETRLFIFGTVAAVSILCVLFLLVAARPAVEVESAGKSLSLAEAPFTVVVLLGLAVLVSGGLLLAPVLRDRT
jgi:hypothetical protein